MTKQELKDKLQKEIKNPQLEDASSKLEALKQEINLQINNAKSSEEKNALIETLSQINKSLEDVAISIDKNSTILTTAISNYVDDYVSNLVVKSGVKVKVDIDGNEYTGTISERVSIEFK